MGPTRLDRPIGLWASEEFPGQRLTVAEGDALPPQATEMILHLREIVEALDGLTASMGEPLPSDASPHAGRQDDRLGGTS
jgi:hypothetical protein